MKNAKINKMLGIITICVNVLLLFHALYLYYCYNFTDKLFLFMFPNWVLLINTLLGIVGVFLSIMLYKKVISIKLFSIVIFLLWLVTGASLF
jgi:hypothetical protein